MAARKYLFRHALIVTPNLLKSDIFSYAISNTLIRIQNSKKFLYIILISYHM
jgi:hypothetical protein